MNKPLILGGILSALAMNTALADKPSEIARELNFITVPATQAIEAAQKLFPGQIYDIDLKSNFVGYYWQVKIFTTDQRFIDAFVDAKTGVVVATDETVDFKGKKKKSRTRYENGMPIQQ